LVGAESGGTFSLSSSDTTIIATDPGGLRLRVKRRSQTPVLVCATASALPGHRACLTLVVQGPAPVRIEGIASYVRSAAPDSGQFAVFVTAPAGASTAATFRSNDPTKVAVTSTGLVRLLAPTPGTTVCASAVADTTRKACATIVLDAAVQGINVQAFLDASGTTPVTQRSILGGTTAWFRGTIFGGAGVDQRVRWSSSDPTALLFDPATGVAKSQKSGVETFACGWSVYDWSLGLCMGLYMRTPSVTSVAVFNNRIGMLVGETRSASVAFREDPPANAQVTWSTGDPTVLSIAGSGTSATITALKPTSGTVFCATVTKPAAPSYKDCGTVRASTTALAVASSDTLGILTFIGDLAANSVVTELGAVRTNVELIVGWAVRGVSAPQVAFRTNDASAVSIGAITNFSANTGFVRVTPLKNGSFPMICGELVGATHKRDCVTLSITGDANMRVRLAPTWAELAVGERVTLVASVDALRGEPTGVQWSSADPSKVTVTAAGVVTAVATTTGTQVCALTTAYTPGRRACATITVR
jgi:hypothetical protein